MTARPWRAAAYVPLGSARLYLASASAKTRAGLDRFIGVREAAGCTVDVWEVLPLTGVADASQVADSSAG